MLNLIPAAAAKFKFGTKVLFFSQQTENIVFNISFKQKESKTDSWEEIWTNHNPNIR